jgi:hypothetical protein
MTAMPSTDPAANGFPTIQMIEGGIPAGLGLPNTTVAQMLEAQRTNRPTGRNADALFQQEWLDACKGRSNNIKHGISSKTNCDFDYAGTMMEQMLLGLVAHRAGKRLEYDGATGRITNMAEANDWLKRPYRPGWTING